jgi:hypothetical protein
MSRTTHLDQPYAGLRLSLLAPVALALPLAALFDVAGGWLAIALASPLSGLLLARLLGRDIRPLSFRFLWWSSVGISVSVLLFPGMVLRLGPMSFIGIWVLINSAWARDKGMAIFGASVFTWSIVATFSVPDRVVIWSVTCALILFAMTYAWHTLRGGSSAIEERPSRSAAI